MLLPYNALFNPTFIHLSISAVNFCPTFNQHFKTRNVAYNEQIFVNYSTDSQNSELGNTCMT